MAGRRVHRRAEGGRRPRFAEEQAEDREPGGPREPLRAVRGGARPALLQEVRLRRDREHEEARAGLRGDPRPDGEA
eukprot:8100793-Pyramimonas_sp.AAC.1